MIDIIEELEQLQKEQGKPYAGHLANRAITEIDSLRTALDIANGKIKEARQETQQALHAAQTARKDMRTHLAGMALMGLCSSGHTIKSASELSLSYADDLLVKINEDKQQ